MVKCPRSKKSTITSVLVGFRHRNLLASQRATLAQSGENPASDQIVVPQLLQVLTANGTSNVIFKGITFVEDNWAPPAAGLGDQQGSPTVTAAISLTNTQNAVFDSDTIAHTQGWGIEFIGNGIGTSSNNQ